MINETDINTLIKLRDILKLFKKPTDILQGEKYITIHLVLTELYTLKTELKFKYQENNQVS